MIMYMSNYGLVHIYYYMYYRVERTFFAIFMRLAGIKVVISQKIKKKIILKKKVLPSWAVESNYIDFSSLIHNS